jgi:1-acyl-sn-glycerol-3-phosphate acyltransferase
VTEHWFRPVPLPERGLGHLRRYAARWVDLNWDVRLFGEHKVPATGPVILAANHLGWLDGPLLFLKAPRPAHALVKSDLFVGKVGRLLNLAAQIPVTRTGADLGSLRRAAQALAAEQVIVIFPEGRRGAGDFKRIRGGVAWLALVSGAPVVPVSIFGSREPGADREARPPKGTEIHVVFGDPMQLDGVPWPRTTEALAAARKKIHAHLKEQLKTAQEFTSATLPGPLP